MQKLLNVVQEFTAWCRMEITVNKTNLLVIDADKKRREQDTTPLLTINGETLQAMNLDDACRYLGYWITGNGDIRATKEVVRQKIIAARDLIKRHLSHQSYEQNCAQAKVWESSASQQYSLSGLKVN